MSEDEKKPRMAKQAAIEIYKAEVARFALRDQRPMIIDLLYWLNSATGCDIEDPLGFFLTDAYDERMKEREEVKSVLSADISKLGSKDLTLDTTNELSSPLSVDAVSRIVNELICKRGVKGFAERKGNCSGLNTSDDDSKGLVVFKAPITGSFGSSDVVDGTICIDI